MMRSLSRLHPIEAPATEAPATTEPAPRAPAPERTAPASRPDVAVVLDHVSKKFVLRQERHRSLQRLLLDLALLRWDGQPDTLWALRDVSFRLERGRTLGIIGQNGSGKSTLLKLLSGVLRPTQGTVQVNGKVSALLELGAGFHPELTGRENVFLNGAFLGLSRRLLAERYEDIVRFAELERFMDTPVKHYSSGMYMRLGFAIAVHVDPDILLIDEVLAVGDASFRQKCYAVFSEFKRRGKTLVYVSHDMNSVARFCDEVLWLDHGEVRDYGEPERVVHRYLQAARQHYEIAAAAERAAHPARPQPRWAAGPVEVKPRETRWGSGEIRIEQVQIEDAPNRPGARRRTGDGMVVRLRYRATVACPDVTFGVAIHRADGLYVHGTSTDSTLRLSVQEGEGEVVCRYESLPLLEGNYVLTVGVWPGEAWRTPFDMRAGVLQFTVASPAGSSDDGLVPIPHTWEVPGLPTDALVRVAPTTRRSGAAPARWRLPPSRMIVGKNDEACLGEGWYAVEDWPPPVRWTGKRATLYLTAPPGATVLGLSLCRPNHRDEPLEGRVLVDGEEAGTIHTAVPHFTAFEYPIRPHATGRVVEVTIEVARVLIPAQEGTSSDTRELGLVVREAWIE
jgi:lipopolysaccharide transport system ATP-binding protein